MVDHFKKWRRRGYLPHFDDHKTTQALTFRLADSYPKKVQEQAKLVLKQHESTGNMSRQVIIQAQAILDKGYGECWMKHAEIADCVQDHLLAGHLKLFILHGWSIMPNHVHLVLTQCKSVSLSAILKQLRLHMATDCNKLLGRRGRFWGRGYFDRYLRDPTHFRKAIKYMDDNPIAAQLCLQPERWQWGSASHHVEDDHWLKGPSTEEPYHFEDKAIYRKFLGNKT